MQIRSFQLIAVAFVRSTGGAVRVLLAIDRDGEPLHEGEPAVLIEHRPGADPSTMEAEVAGAVPAVAADAVLENATELAACIEAAFDRSGTFDGQRLLGTGVTFSAPHDTFGG